MPSSISLFLPLKAHVNLEERDNSSFHRQTADINVTQQVTSVSQRGIKASDIPGMCHRFEHPRVVHCGSMASSRGWSFYHDIMGGSGEKRYKRVSSDTCSQTAAVHWKHSCNCTDNKNANHLLSSMSTNTNVLLLITLWASVQDGESIF